MNKVILNLVLIWLAFMAGYLTKQTNDDETTKPVDTHPAIWRPAAVTLATEGEAPLDKTCDVINLNGREWGLPFYVIDREGSQCHRIIGAPNGPDAARLCPTASNAQS